MVKKRIGSCMAVGIGAAVVFHFATACTTNNTTVIQSTDGGSEQTDPPSEDGTSRTAEGGASNACTIEVTGPTAARSATCDACFTSKCSNECGACSGNAACKRAATCIATCGSDADCFDECRRGLPAATLTMLNDAIDPIKGCAAIQCGPQCYAKAGIGDPCTSDFDCPPGGCFVPVDVPRPAFGVCRGNCKVNEDCRSTASSITNRSGKLVFCWEGDHCFPQCETDADCKQYSGGTCLSGGAGVGVKVCR